MQQLTFLKSVPIPVTNKEKERFYVIVQTAKLELARCEKGVAGVMAKTELLKIWRELCELEGLWCNTLAFREHPLTLHERLCSLLAWTVYVGFFCVLVPLSRFVFANFFSFPSAPDAHDPGHDGTFVFEEDVGEALLVVGQHKVAKWLLGTLLNVNVCMKRASSSATGSLSGEGELRVLCYSPTSWVDELAFYASGENPLVVQSIAISLECEEQNARRKQQKPSPADREQIDIDRSASRRRASCPRYVLYKPSWLRGRGHHPSTLSQITSSAFLGSLSSLAKDSDTRREVIDLAKTSLATVSTSFGYPVATASLPPRELLQGRAGAVAGEIDVAGESDGRSVVIVPLVSRGVPTTLFVSQAVGRADRHLAKSGSQHFDEVMSIQYKQGTAPDPSQKMMLAEKVSQAAKAPEILVANPSALPLTCGPSLGGVCGGTIELFLAEPTNVISGSEVVEATLAAYRALYSA